MTKRRLWVVEGRYTISGRWYATAWTSTSREGARDLQRRMYEFVSGKLRVVSYEPGRNLPSPTSSRRGRVPTSR